MFVIPHQDLESFEDICRKLLFQSTDENVSPNCQCFSKSGVQTLGSEKSRITSSNMKIMSFIVMFVGCSSSLRSATVNVIFRKTP